MTKSELAQAVGISVRILYNWCLPYREELERMGVTRTTKLLNPKVVKWMVRHFDIDVE